MAARVEISDMDTSPHNLPPLAPPVAPGHRNIAEGVVAPDSRQLWWSLPLLTVAGLVVAFVIVAALVPLRRWQQAPGSALSVADRLVIDGVDRFDSDGEVMFVTASGARLSLLDAAAAWIDDDVEVLTYEQRFGPRTPTEQRRIGFQAMFGSKQIAEYVAFRTLGFDASFQPGPAVVNELVCPNERPTRSACDVLEVGDTIVAIDGEPTPLLEDIGAQTAGRKAGDVVSVTVRPYQQTTTVEREIELISSPDDPTRAIVGFMPADTRSVDLPFEVDIDTSRIGGPSAGLAFTLALIEELNPASLTGGALVAATGTINEDGSVGAIGALRQKTVAVLRAGGDVFLVPASQPPSELAAAREVAGDRLKIVPVANLAEALAALEDQGGDLTGLNLDAFPPPT
jgi:PDZ domain-containing protein